jgi:competence protein ComFC
MPNCLACHSSFASTYSWNELHLLEREKRLCFRCESSLVRITGPICTACGRSMQQDGICSDCLAWNGTEQAGLLTKNRSVFIYNDKMKEIMNQFKFRGDIEVIKAFQQDLVAAFKREFKHVNYIVPIPLSTERLYERGFNQAEVIANLLGTTTTILLAKAYQEKQSKKSKAERKKERNPFSFVGSDEVIGKHVLLVDDLYTTGTTLRNVSKVLIEAGVASCSSLTLVRS